MIEAAEMFFFFFFMFVEVDAYKIHNLIMLCWRMSRGRNRATIRNIRVECFQQIGKPHILTNQEHLKTTPSLPSSKFHRHTGKQRPCSRLESYENLQKRSVLLQKFQPAWYMKT